MSITRGQDIAAAARRLKDGQLVAFPTETVYGLGANAADEQAIRAVFAAKGRPLDHPVIVHVAHPEAAQAWASPVTAEAERLMAAFWPGPLTLVLPRHPRVSMTITGGQETVALRCPAHPVAQSLLQAFARLCGPQAGVIAPSANRFGQVSPTEADHVQDEFGEVAGVDIYLLEGGASEVGIESTILDLGRPGQPPRILRPGHIGAREIAAVLGTPVQPFEALAAAHGPRVSGSLKAHYAPQTRLRLFQRPQLKQWLTATPGDARIAIVSCGALSLPVAAGPAWQFESLPDNEKDYAAALYRTLRRLDQGGFEALWFELPPQTDAWSGVNDRLRRAAAAFGG